MAQDHHATRRPTRHAPSLTRLLALTTSAAAILTCAAGCTDRDEAARALRDATSEIRRITPGTGPASSPEYAAERFQAASRRLDPHSADFAAAGAVLAGTRVGETMLDLDRYAGLERQARRELTVLRATLSKRQRLAALAAAAAEFDPEPEYRYLDELDEERRREIARFQQTREEIAGRIADLESSVEDLQRRAAEQRDRAGELELQIARVSAVEGAEIAERVREHTRRSDALEVEAQKLQIRLNQLRPGENEARLNTERLEEQRELIRTDRAEAEQRAQAAQQDTVEARAQAGVVEEEIDELVRAIVRFRAGDLADLAERAARDLERAASVASRTQTDSPVTGRLAVAEAQLVLASLLHQRANGHAQTAAALENLADAEPALENANDYAGLAREARRAEREARAAAADGFDAVASALRGVRATGQLRERLESLVTRYESLARVMRGQDPLPDEPAEEEWNDQDWDDDQNDAQNNEWEDDGWDDGEG